MPLTSGNSATLDTDSLNVELGVIQEIFRVIGVHQTGLCVIVMPQLPDAAAVRQVRFSCAGKTSVA